MADGVQISSRSFKISGATKSAPTRCFTLSATEYDESSSVYFDASYEARDRGPDLGAAVVERPRRPVEDLIHVFLELVFLLEPMQDLDGRRMAGIALRHEHVNQHIPVAPVHVRSDPMIPLLGAGERTELRLAFAEEEVAREAHGLL